ncbi:unnamed protein product [Brassica rapa]|uniref:HMA domain-containing protein n=1 Tax=Brassica campestris TaxID=3711 RepID=A0A8D9DRE7_BRACM|nr:unnamed protein product [Brassica rapa]
MMLLPLPVIPVLLLVCLPTALFLMLQQSTPYSQEDDFVCIWKQPLQTSSSLASNFIVLHKCFVAIFQDAPLFIASVESFDVDIKEQKVTVKGNVQPDAVLQTVSKTGKKSAFWDTEAETAKA